MKKLLLIINLLLIFGCNGNIEKTEIDISSAQCGMCAVTIEGALNKIEGVQEAIVDMDALKVTVAYDGDKADLKSFELAISNAGYQANGTLANAEVYKTLPGCCKLPEDR